MRSLTATLIFLISQLAHAADFTSTLECRRQYKGSNGRVSVEDESTKIELTVSRHHTSIYERREMYFNRDLTEVRDVLAQTDSLIRARDEKADYLMGSRVPRGPVRGFQNTDFIHISKNGLIAKTKSRAGESAYYCKLSSRQWNQISLLHQRLFGTSSVKFHDGSSRQEWPQPSGDQRVRNRQQPSSR